jgi:hypothetical protein
MKLSSSFSLNDSPGAWNNRYRLTEVFGERSYRPVKWNSALRPEISQLGSVGPRCGRITPLGQSGRWTSLLTHFFMHTRPVLPRRCDY